MIYAHGIPFLDQDALDRYNDKRKEIASRYPSIDLDINNRWESGTEHHKKSLEIMKQLQSLDLYFNSDYFCWKSGGDGDNGESLMYLLDIIFEAQDAKQEAGE